ncbi:histidinol-phosphatase [Marispirochaeta sp.]|uniref:histidinol-phosphatase n=1 Tax=Marispirochaeta sp. TaxID=2038653 RepID=UPI0029C6EB79|nr:histidinol-phosphatase [Marispirochaeta sp.]
MIPQANYHTHNSLCDGAGELEEYIEAARRKGFSALGFTSHAPLPFDNDWTLAESDLTTYCDRVKNYKYLNGLEIYLGLEIDYIPGKMGPAQARWQQYGLDYTIGSVHMIPHEGKAWSIDGPDDEFIHLYKQVYHGDGTAMAVEYYRLLTEMIRQGGFTILGHLDLIKKKNLKLNFLDEQAPAYTHAVHEVLDALAESGIFMEINSGGIFRGVTKDVYPSPAILQKACRRNIPIVINSDAHTPEALDFYFPEACSLARQAGYTTAMMLLGESWQEIPLGES